MCCDKARRIYRTFRSKSETFLWFAARPTFLPHFFSLIVSKLWGSVDSVTASQLGKQWCETQVVDSGEALNTLGLVNSDSHSSMSLPAEHLKYGEHVIRDSVFKVGGRCDVNFLYSVVKLMKAKRVLETGVGFGWSSLAILIAQNENSDGMLVSVDMPYPKMNNESAVGIVVPPMLRKKWVLIREPDRNGLRRAFRALDGPIDLCHYDSDKSYRGREYAYCLIWDKLRPGGILISDDINDNLCFANFCRKSRASFTVTYFEGRYVGSIRKPLITS